MKSNRVIKVFSKNKILKKEFIRENKFSRKTEFLRKSVVFIVTISMILGMAGCGKTTEKEDNYRLKIVASLFPYYDMARAVIGDVKGIDLKMIVTPGQDSHSFEPTPSDVIQMENADVLIYNGGSLETWIDTLLDSLNNKNKIQMKMMDYVDVLNEEIVEGMDTRFEEHDHEEHSHKEDNHNKENHKEDSHSEENHKEDNHSEDSSNDSEFHNEDSEEEHEETDEHIWTSPVNEIIMTEKICETLSKALPEEKENFQKNAENYISQLKELDNEFRTIVENAKTKEIIFADKFPLQYFAKEYGLKYYAAFPGCGSDMEPSAKTIAFLVDKIKEDNIKAVFYLELSSHIVADAIETDTGAKPLQFNSCHNITQKQFDSGVTYVDLMKENVNNLKIALGE
ncbi:zinc ABC transporter substrate-binding protein [Eubacterium ventriosum]|jgi:zinc transport system substrate-binding protein|uniref:Zinc ABC transporter substrate-binding protein n=1 Tax=Eubacterium ventriosum TaxID=39496 RepID=A0A413RAB0_9FIRM|nr:metal ABC transporter substrate-binding protein [Eubacterium ventriosum]RHA19431.1 zinc ABC transporter substrate-binding protein [Eubacterium ventriosum]RHB17154.1 zinc ABC transporter substrate-binding protein [Eubacterium ventriosum]